MVIINIIRNEIDVYQVKLICMNFLFNHMMVLYISFLRSNLIFIVTAINDIVNYKQYAKFKSQKL